MTRAPSGTRRVRYAAGLALAGLAVVVAVGAIATPDLGGAVAGLSRSIGGWTYPIVGALAFLETAALIGLLVPGETAVVAAGVVAGRGDVQLLPLIALVWLAAAAGDCVSFLLGRRLGRHFLKAHGARFHLDAARLERVERFFERHGGKAVLGGRFVGVARSVTPFLAGASGFPLRRFLPWSAAGTLAWAGLLATIGYAFAGSLADAGQLATRITLGAAVVFLLLVALIGRLRPRRRTD